MSKTMAFIAAVSENDIDTVWLVSIVAVALLLVVMLLLSTAKVITDTRMMANAGISIAAAFALSFIQIKWMYGGSITLASFVPLIIFSFAYGPAKGLAAGLIYSVLQFIQAPYFIHPAQLLLDFPLAFCSVALAGIFKDKFKSRAAEVLLGIACVGIARLAMHTAAGIFFFNAGIIVPEIAADNAFVYSFIYNVSYVPFDILLSAAVLFYLIKTGGFDTLIKVMRKQS